VILPAQSPARTLPQEGEAARERLGLEENRARPGTLPMPGETSLGKLVPREGVTLERPDLLVEAHFFFALVAVASTWGIQTVPSSS